MRAIYSTIRFMPFFKAGPLKLSKRPTPFFNFYSPVFSVPLCLCGENLKFDDSEAGSQFGFWRRGVHADEVGDV